MNRVLKVGLASLLCATLGFSYSANGDLGVTYTGYKTMKKVGVKGTFKNVELTSSKSDKFADFVKSLNVKIDALSLDTKLKIRNDNISIIFKNAKSSTVLGKVLDVKGDDKSGMMDVEITMNDVAKKIAFSYNVNGENLEAKGNLDILDFAMDKSFADFAKKCKGFHAGKTWSEVAVEFSLPFKK